MALCQRTLCSLRAAPVTAVCGSRAAARPAIQRLLYCRKKFISSCSSTSSQLPVSMSALSGSSATTVVQRRPQRVIAVAIPSSASAQGGGRSAGLSAPQDLLHFFSTSIFDTGDRLLLLHVAPGSGAAASAAEKQQLAQETDLLSGEQQAPFWLTEEWANWCVHFHHHHSAAQRRNQATTRDL